MKLPFNSFIFILVCLITCISCSETSCDSGIKIIQPEDQYKELFYDVQSDSNIFSDCKIFVDCVPRYDIETILGNYSVYEDKSSEVISDFIYANFNVPSDSVEYISDSLVINDHIHKLWEVLKRTKDEGDCGTIIPLPHSYIVPGGRFREIYYWDSYFTMLGLSADNQISMIQDMIDNFAYLIDMYGFIPNGNRTYYLSRSQPPFFSLMIDLLAELKGGYIYMDYAQYLEKEYHFWMNGLDSLNSDKIECSRVVRMPDGEIMNRYWDSKDIPRPESYREDVKTANEAIRNIKGIRIQDVFRNLRAAAESGWDFSSRWLSIDSCNEFRLYTIHTTDIIPVDLNSLLYKMEFALAKAYKLSNNLTKADLYENRYKDRKKAIIKYCWDSNNGFFMDYNFRNNESTGIFSLAGVFPLFFNIATDRQADIVADKIHDIFLKPGGVVTSLYNTGQQWDAPNGWAPLQWITIEGLKQYGNYSLADEIKERWLELNRKVYDSTFKIVEKYDVIDLTKVAGGGEYTNQDGFGWTNGVYQKLSIE